MKTPAQIWDKYQSIVEYVTSKDLFEIVKKNENFYDGRQWEGVEASNMPKPVVNILQRVVKYLVATLSSNDIAISLTPYSSAEDDKEAINIISEEVERVIEQAKMKEASKLAIRNSAVDGSSYMLQLFDHTIETGQDLKGRIANILVDNTNVYFGNPYSSDIQGQPFIIIALRQYVKQVQEEARSLGVKEEDIEMIKADDDTNQPNDDSDKLCTVLMCFEKKKHKVIDIITNIDELTGEEITIEEEKEVTTVFFSKSTRNVFIKKPTDMGYVRYPLACFGWDPIKNSYLYNSPMTSVIPNQIFINKCYAIAQMYGLQSAFPKIVYDKNKVQIDNFLKDTSPQAVAGIDSMGKFLDFIKVPDFSNNIMSLLESTIAQTKECMGVNDASLGNVKPDNTSAIIALQESSNVPLEIQRQGFYQMWEDVIRNILDIMSCDYGKRIVMGEDGIGEVDFSLLKNINYELNVDVGNGAQFSEISQINTLDKLFQTGIIDAKTYVESIPSKYIPNKGKILKHLEELEQKQMELNQVPQIQ